MLVKFNKLALQEPSHTRHLKIQSLNEKLYCLNEKYMCLINKRSVDKYINLE